AEPGEHGRADERAHRPVDVVERGRAGNAVGPGAEHGEEREDGPAPRPEPEPAAIAAEGGRDADPAPPAAREEVDRRREERQQRTDQHELDGPAADDAAA